MPIPHTYRVIGKICSTEKNKNRDQRFSEQQSGS